jgi:hypothetical protein
MKNLKSEFVPYGLALRLKNLGFNEQCLAYYSNGEFTSGIAYNSDDDIREFESVAAPLFSQIFRWFREKKYKSSIAPYIDTNTTDETYCFEIFKDKQFMFETDFIYKTYDEVELSMLEKLIELEEKESENTPTKAKIVDIRRDIYKKILDRK